MADSIARRVTPCQRRQGVGSYIPTFLALSSPAMGKLDGKVALISGGARGQGAAEAEIFVREGAKVVFGDIRDDEGKKVEAAIRAGGGDAIYLHLDVTSEADWRAAVQTALDSHGRLDVLVNNAAIVIPRGPVEERTVPEWDQVIAVKGTGGFLRPTEP